MRQSVRASEDADGGARESVHDWGMAFWRSAAVELGVMFAAGESHDSGF